MNKIVIIGNSFAGHSCCQALLKHPSTNEITVISQEGSLPYKRNLLIEYLADHFKENELFLREPDFYKKNNIRFLSNSKVARLDTKKQSVVLKDNQRINFDYLVIASGQKVNIPDIPGNTKDGIFSVYTLEDAKKIKDKLMLTDTVCVSGDSDLCLRFWEAFVYKGKHIKIISSPKQEIPVSAENTEWIDEFKILEFIGEGSELKALKLNNGKVIGAPLVLFLGNYIPCADFLKESAIERAGDFIVVDDSMRTNFENIFACGSIAKLKNNPDKQKSWEEIADEGVRAAENLIHLLERGKTPCQMF